MALNGKGRRVAVTGMGVVTCIGTGVDKFWNAIKSGTHGIGPIESFSLQDLYIKIGGEVRDFDPAERCKSKAVMLSDRFSQYASAAAHEAVDRKSVV
jgi:3-oxoacyl-(acyl-carrier-protein) synthase